MPDSNHSPTPRQGSDFTVEDRAGASVVVIQGDLDLATAPGLKRTLFGLFRRGPGRVVLDFSGVGFMDSTALSVLIGIHRKLLPEERLAIAHARAEVVRLVELSGVAASVRIFPTLDAALAYVGDGGGVDGPPAVPPLTADAALILGIASTAMPFAQSDEDQVERWLRVLRRHGEAGVVLASLGLSDAPLGEVRPDEAPEPSVAADPDVLAAVTEQAGRIATQRGGARTATTDVLLAVMHIYGATFDRVLAAHGADIDELATRVAGARPAAAA